ncbi:aldo/keto reductase [Streptomyces sp. NPDC056390]|uniref:aldo/keto reductase n=1 Tax=Streptomyces sp. NPDC056390 TaxID=3345806 RepID=UPI0035E15FD6
MKFRTLGKSGLRVSPLCLGTMTFGEEWGWGADPETSHKIVDRFLEAGGNFIDTANAYTKGHSEKIVGDYFAARKGRRDRTVLATKFFSGMFPGDPNSGGAGRKAILGQIEESLRRLQTDYIDLYWMHAWDAFTPIEETMRSLDDLVAAGKVRYIGFSDTPAWKVAQAQVLAELKGWAPLAALQIEYSLRERTVEAELVPAADELGMGIVPWSPLAGGILTGKYRPGSTEGSGGRLDGVELSGRDEAILSALDVVAGEVGTSPASVALAWVRERPGVDSTILGARRIEQLDDNLASLQVTLTDEQRARLDEASSFDLPFPQRALPQMVNFAYAGTTINGHSHELLDMIPESDAARY